MTKLISVELITSCCRSGLKAVGVGLITLATLLPLPLAYGQYSSNLEGVVTDPTGAVIPNATVEMTNSATQVTNKQTTDKGGNFRFNSVAPGDYEILASAEGFNSTRVKVTLLTGQIINVPVTLSLAGTRQTVEVTGQVTLLDTADSRQQMTIESQELHSLPLQGHNFLGLAAVTPGVTGLGVLVGSSPGACPSGLPSTIPDNFATEMPVEVSQGGKGEESNAFLLDGLDVTSNINGGVINMTPNPDSIQEMSVETNDYGVEYGRSSAVLIKMTTKSGSGKYHGSAGDSFTDQHLWARSQFTGPSYAPFLSNNFSGSVGGPIVPHHSTYFFAAVEPLRSTFSTGNQEYSFEDPQFTSWAAVNSPNTIGTSLLTKYPVHASALGVSQTAQDIFPTTCATSATLFIPCSLPMIDSGTYEASPYRNALQWNVRIDTYIGKDRLYGNFYRMTHNDQSPNIRPAFDSTNRYTSNSLQVNDTHTFSPTTLNEGMFGFLRPEGINNLSGPFSVPLISVVGMSSGFGLGFAGGDFIQHNYRWRDVITQMRGTHSLKFGYEGWHGNDLAIFASSFTEPVFQFNSLIDLVQDNAYSENNVAYNPLTGQPDTKANYEYAKTSQGAFVQDTWKAKSNLTLTLGFRWDNYGNPYPYTGTVLANFFLGQGSTQAEQVANGVMKQVGHVYNHAINAFSPRVGFAWDPTGKGDWAVRGGVGAFHDWMPLGADENQLKGNPPGFIFPNFIRGTTTQPLFVLGTSNTYPFGFQFPIIPPTTIDSHGGLVGDQLGVGGMNENLGAPKTYNFSFSVERRLPGKLMASAAYAASYSIDQVTGSVMNQFRGTDINRFAGDLIQNQDVLTRILPSFGAINYTTNETKAEYNALILALEKRYGDRAQFTASYTRSSGWYDGQQYPDQNKITSYWQPSLFDSPNRISFGGTYNPPVPKIAFRPVQYAAEGWEISSTLILQSGYPFTVSTNAPFEPIQDANGNVTGVLPGSGDYNADGYDYDFPNAPSTGYNLTSRSRQAFLNGALSASEFPVPAMGTEGNELPGRFRGPGYANVDFGLIKNNRITEKVALQLRFEFFNLFNRTNLNGVDSNLPDATFGQSITSFNPRWIQIGAKISF
ncbi:MAG: TonB-dependent receptor [Terriglobia bacterium]